MGSRKPATPVEQQSERTLPRRRLQSRSGSAAAETRRATELTDALGTEETVVLEDGKTYCLGPWRLGGLKAATQRYGSLASFHEALILLMPTTPDAVGWEPNLDDLSFVVWLALRRNHPELTPADLDDLLPVNLYEVAAIFGTAMRVSGAMGAAAEGSPDPPDR